MPPSRITVPDTSPTRKRKAHTKSRGGCGNCKIRHVKCDEAKPHCKRCQSFGVSCTYDRISSDLQSLAEAAFTVNIPQTAPVSLNQQVLGMLNDSVRRQSARDRAFQFNMHDLELINRFHERTIMSMGTDDTRHIYQRECVRLAFEHPFLFHLVLTLTLMHDRFNTPAKQTPRELFHWSQGTSQFNKVLSGVNRGALTSSQKDAIWVASTIVGCTTLAQMEGDTPEDVWPLTSSPCDLDWLKMSDGKREIWRIADLRRPDSALRDLAHAPSDNFMIKISDREALKILPPEMLELLELNDASASADNNVYYTQAAIMGRLLPMTVASSNLLMFLTFLSHMPARFKTLLEQRDARALLLLAYFEAKVSEHGQWWWWKRATLEGQAICLYLERYHSSIPQLEPLLAFPKAHCSRGFASLGSSCGHLSPGPRLTSSPSARSEAVACAGSLRDLIS
ncbi:hypothetical protein QBC46DRAFT_323547 [Diplogelasinospora grovesii]|uniref:Zn(2)-C6 fungal-type domain-containing protein n=1 Tax=Diplogelasinospora grovesii TaxID=303347 RepID=A0AAN6MZ22_9PEZI|nr:hypothetical protein QBC46DRAFT_323547 [Diplogelasinospora grovesii]